MLKVYKHIILLATLLLCGSCSELYEVGELVDIEHITMSRHEADLRVGDTLQLEARLSPEAATASLRWTLDEPSRQSARILGRRVWAIHPGEALVRVEAYMAGSIETNQIVPHDTCRVHVFDWQPPAPHRYPFETVVIATFRFNGIDLTPNLGDVLLVATVNGEVRGWAEPRVAQGIPYLQLRIGSDVYGEPARIECYSPRFFRRVPLLDLELNGERHGTLSDPLRLSHEASPQ